MNIKKIVSYYKRKTGTADPFDIADQLGILYQICNLQFEGCYMFLKNHRYIFINENLPEHEQRLVMAHELGHAILHRKENCYFIRNKTLLLNSKKEIEANRFAMELLVSDSLLKEYRDFTTQARTDAKDIGSTTTQITSSAADFSRLGYSLNESQTLAKNTGILKNVSEFGSIDDATTAMISILFIVLAVVFGFMVYRKNVSLGVSTIAGVAAIVVCVVVGLNFHPIYLSETAWMVIVGIYITVASVAPVWILLQPRDYLSSFLLYFMMIVAAVGVIGSALMGHASLDIPAFTGFKDTLAPTGSSLGFMFPALFVTIACGAISGFHSLVGSGTTSKQLDNEKNARPIAYGGMLIECALAIVSLCAVGYIWSRYADGTTVVPTAVFATGISEMVATIPGLGGSTHVLYSLLVLTVSVFCLTSLDTATRLARYMFQEFWLEPGQTYKEATGYKAVLTNPVVSTVITVVLGIGLGLTGYSKIWPLFGASNQLLAAIGLLAVATWLGKVGKNNKMFLFPMVFMLIVTITSLVQTLIANFKGLGAGVGIGWCVARIVLAGLLVILALILAFDGFKTLANQKKAK